jgi:hypothetical protein
MHIWRHSGMCHARLARRSWLSEQLGWAGRLSEKLVAVRAGQAGCLRCSWLSEQLCAPLVAVRAAWLIVAPYWRMQHVRCGQALVTGSCCRIGCDSLLSAPLKLVRTREGHDDSVSCAQQCAHGQEDELFRGSYKDVVRADGRVQLRDRLPQHL